MTLRTSYIVGLIACTAVGLTSVQIIESAQAETLKITGPNGEVKQQAKRQYGPTTSRDTFWSIAQKVRPSDKVSIYQVMAALFDANPHAFSGNNYNTLERGMILLVPSVDVIAAIPNDVAKRRAEQDDRRANRQTQPRPVINKPIQSPIVETPKKPTAAKPLQIVQQTPAVAVQTKAINEANAVVVNDLNSTLDKANAKTLMVTDELARAQDELMVSNNDNQALKNKIEQMSLNISSLEEDLQLLREKYEALNLENKKLVDQTENAEPVVEEPTDFWRSLMDNTILLILAASIPLLIIFGLIFWLLSRRNKKSQQSEVKTATQSEQESAAATGSDDLDDSDDIVVHLDSSDEDSIDDLLDLDSVDLQPEIQMEDDAEMDMASDMFVSETEIEDEEGTSLDDLWAEAMEDQDSDLEPLEDDDDLDSLLAGLDDKPAATLNSAAPEDDLDSLLAGLDEDTGKDETDDLDASAENDIDSLLAEFDMPAEPDDVAAAAVKSADTSADDDIDALLAEFDMPAESDDVAAAAAVKSADTSAEDDIDALLAEFDMPAESDDVAAAAAVKSADTSAEDDIDALLAEFDMPAEPDDVAAETPVKSAEAKADDDIDALLAEFDMPAEPDDVAAETPVKSAETNAEEDLDLLLSEPDSEQTDVDAPTATDEDIDQLLAGLSATKDENEEDSSTDDGDTDLQPLNRDSIDNDDDIAALIAAELQDDTNEDIQDVESSDDDIDALLSSLNEPVIESVFDEKSDELSTGEQQTSDSDDLAAQIAAELSDDDVVDSIDDNETSDDDIDALLASLNEPVIESDAFFQEKAAVQAQIAAELDDDISDEESISDDESLDDDINTLLASFKEDIKDDTPSENDTENPQYGSAPQVDSTQPDNESIDDNALFDEFDEYLNDTDLTNTVDTADIETNKYIEPEADADKAADSDDEDNRWLDAELEAALASTSSNDVETDQETTAAQAPTSETDDGLDALLAQMDDEEAASSSAKSKINKDSGFFNDLKSSKPKPELLDWESDLLKAAESAADEREVDEADVSDDDLLAAFSQSLNDDDNDDDFTSEDEYILSDDNLTVDEALAALDQKERSQSTEYKASDDDLMRFERENGYIDIDKLLNDADEDDDKTDQYKDVNVDMGSASSLMGNPNMVDVDDEENSVNAKLDLARAYIEIEDQDSARALLKEVQMDGNERQQLEAKNLLKSVS
jgi:pilus assembly protein FimV